MADHPNVALVRRGYAAFGSGDMDTLCELFAADVGGGRLVATVTDADSNVLGLSQDQ